jgi:mannose-6-phosphate isomerase
MFMNLIDKSELYPLLFDPIYVEIMWGGNLMSTFLGRDLPERDTPIAESWEISDREGAESIIENGILAGTSIRELLDEYGKSFAGNVYDEGARFPLLVKLIDAGKRLSLQVHPDEIACEKLPGAEPKTEMWYVIAATPEAKIIAGLKHNSTQRKFLDSVGSENIEDCLQIFKSEPGDAYYINSGTVHAIGGGNLLLEIQQNSNTTYRISDWGRVGLDGKPRELHIEEALQSVNFADRSSPRICGPSDSAHHNRKFPIVNRCPFFKVEDLRLVENWMDRTDGESLHLITSINHSITIEGKGDDVIVERGRSCIIPANYGRYYINIGEGKESTVVKTILK